MYSRKISWYKFITLALMLALIMIVLSACFPLEATPAPVSTRSPQPTVTSAPTNTPAPTPTTAQTPNITATPELIEQQTPTPNSPNVIERQYKWSFDHSEWTWSLEVPQSLYDYYRQLPRPPTQDYSVYVTHPQDDSYLEMLAQKIRDAASEARLDRWETVNFSAAFVQSLPYASDSVTTGYDEYPRYPIETLMDNGGDCEDTSILIAALLEQLGYDNVLITLPDHMAVGVLGDDSIHGSYYEHNGGKYYFLETTGEGWELGEMPPDHEGQSAEIYDIVPVPILTHKWDATYRGNEWKVIVTVENQGTAAAQGVSIIAGFDAANDLLWNLVESEAFDLAADYSMPITLYLNAPSNEYTRLIVQIVDDGYSVDESYSEWLNTD